MPTIWQYGALRVNDDTATHTFDDGGGYQKLIQAGYARVEFLLNARPDHLGPVARWKVDAVKRFGGKAWGVFWADSFRGPLELLGAVQQARSDYLFSGFVINAEDGWESRDMAGLGWSKTFVRGFRNTPSLAKLSLALDTYNGCGGIELPWWQNYGARLICQTHHESKTHEWPIDGYMSWAKQYGWTKPSMIKPEFGVYNPKPARAEQIAAAIRAGTKGFIAYYAEGAGDPADTLLPLLTEARQAGVCA